MSDDDFVPSVVFLLGNWFEGSLLLRDLPNNVFLHCPIFFTRIFRKRIRLKPIVFSSFSCYIYIIINFGLSEENS